MDEIIREHAQREVPLMTIQMTGTPCRVCSELILEFYKYYGREVLIKVQQLKSTNRTLPEPAATWHTGRKETAWHFIYSILIPSLLVFSTVKILMANSSHLTLQFKGRLSQLKQFSFTRAILFSYRNLSPLAAFIWVVTFCVISLISNIQRKVLSGYIYQAIYIG